MSPALRRLPILTLLAIAACSLPATRGAVTIDPALDLEGSAYGAAGAVELPDTEAGEAPGLHQVFRLSENIISGAEPHGAEAFEQLAAMGVKTILSVDGKAPDAETARRHGLRYVHVPIQYRGVTADEKLRIVKTFRELEGPFFVHCFHGRHRGPAAAALGAVVLDGAPRDRSIGQMRQWCGTSSRYEALYEMIAVDDVPSVAETEAYDWDFPAAHRFVGLRPVMIDSARSFDRIEAMAMRAWQVNPDHPDVDPVNEAAILTGLMEQAGTLEETAGKPADYRAWIAAAVSQSRSLEQALADARKQLGTWDAAEEILGQLDTTCNACHAAYRNR